MGLDLYFYKKNVYDKYCEDFDECEKQWEKLREEGKSFKEIDEIAKSPECPEELIYGRKTWSIYYWFADREDSIPYCPDEDGKSDDYIISKDAFKDFFELLLPYKSYLKMLDDVDDENATELDWATAERIYNVISNGTSAQLGELWDCHVFYKALLAMDKVLEVYDSGDEIVMIASY